ncbi:MAG: LPS export ABC transporter permease LptF [Caulobacterales bacterium 68-7]|nr:MAG: LPS export ABC transporter permease LptF [Caulobacterales bacterium 68-7]
MRLIERYFLRQLLGPTLLATAALCLVTLLGRSLSELEIIVEQRQSALVFLKIILLAVPQLLNTVMPISVFVAALVALNRLHTEQEIVVCFASGMSRWRVISPAVRLASVAALLSLIIGLWLQPYTAREIRETSFQVRADIAATLVREGAFTEPSAGLTVYSRTIDRGGLIHDLFIHQTKQGGGDTTYSSREGRVGTRNGAPVLIMTNGSTQEFSNDGTLNFLRFDEYIFDLAPFVQSDELLHYKEADRYMHELFFPDLQQDWERKNKDRLLAEGHSRLAGPLYNIAFMAMALAAVLGSSFSRLGYGRRIARVGAAAAAVRLLGVGIQAACADSAYLNILQYAVPIGAAWWGFKQVFRSAGGTGMSSIRTRTKAKKGELVALGPA